MVCAEPELSFRAKAPIDFEARWIAIVVWIEEIGFQFSGLDSREPFAGYFPFTADSLSDGDAGIDPHCLTVDRKDWIEQGESPGVTVSLMTWH